VPVTVVEIKAEHEVSCMSLCPPWGISGSHPELPVLHVSHKTYPAWWRGNFLQVLFDMSQEDCFLLHIASGVLLPFCVTAISELKNQVPFKKRYSETLILWFRILLFLKFTPFFMLQVKCPNNNIKL
jgi:hypothetical protein